MNRAVGDTTMRKILRPALVAASVLGATAVHSQTPPLADDTAAAHAPLAEAERDFISAASLIDKSQIEAAQIALARSPNPRVRELAQEILAGHEQSHAALHTVVERELLTGAALGAAGKHMLTELREASGESFDRVYIASTLRSHTDALTQLERGLAALRDEALRQTAERSLILLRDHRDRAREIEASMLAAPPTSRTRR